MKLYYFPLYGRAEPIRVLLAKAGVEYEDVRVPFAEWGPMKAANFSETGQMPVFELDDGTKLVQSGAILRYLGKTYNYIPADPMVEYYGEATFHGFKSDFLDKQLPKILAATPDEKKGAWCEMANTHFLPWVEKFATRLTKGKYICGDDLSIYDFVVGGWMLDVCTNPNNQGKEAWDVVFPQIPERVKQDLADYKAENADYYAKRPESTF